MDTGQENVQWLLLLKPTATASPRGSQRIDVLWWGGRARGICLRNDRAILMAPPCSWWWVWSVWLWWNGLWEDLGVSLPSRLSMSAWGRNRKYKINVRLPNRRKWKTRTRTNETPNQKQKKKEKRQPGYLHAFHLPKYLSYICQYFFLNAFRLSGCSQHFFGRGLKKKNQTHILE